MSNHERGSVRVIAPATVANVGCAFDVLGFAVDAPGDYLTAEKTPERGVTIVEIAGDNGRLPREASKNTAAVAASHALDLLEDVRCGRRGCCQRPLRQSTLQKRPRPTRDGRRTHRVRDSPCGQCCACPLRRLRSHQIVELPVPPNLRCTIVHPHLEVLTEDARKVLRRNLPLATVIRQFASIAGLVARIFSNNYPLIGRSLEDVIIEPERCGLIPGFSKVKRAAIEAGALGCAISGSGPSLFAFSTSDAGASEIGEAMREGFQREGVASDVFVSSISTTGARIIEEP